MSSDRERERNLASSPTGRAGVGSDGGECGGGRENDGQGAKTKLCQSLESAWILSHAKNRTKGHQLLAFTDHTETLILHFSTCALDFA